MTTVSDVSNTTGSTNTSAASSWAASYDTFLQLLCTQLENQNPLDPLDSTEFVTQLAQYSALEQQISTNDKLESVLSALDGCSGSFAVSYIGRTVEAVADTVTIDQGEGAEWIYNLGSAAEEVTLEITDDQGEVVWSGSGETSAGRHTLEWDGCDSAGKPLPDGSYTLKVTATDADGKAVTSTTCIRGTVTGVDTSSGTTVLELGDTEVELENVVRVTA